MGVLRAVKGETGRQLRAVVGRRVGRPTARRARAGQYARMVIPGRALPPRLSAAARPHWARWIRAVGTRQPGRRVHRAPPDRVAAAAEVGVHRAVVEGVPAVVAVAEAAG